MKKCARIGCGRGSCAGRPEVAEVAEAPAAAEPASVEAEPANAEAEPLPLQSGAPPPPPPPASVPLEDVPAPSAVGNAQLPLWPAGTFEMWSPTNLSLIHI